MALWYFYTNKKLVAEYDKDIVFFECAFFQLQTEHAVSNKMRSSFQVQRSNGCQEKIQRTQNIKSSPLSKEKRKAQVTLEINATKQIKIPPFHCMINNKADLINPNNKPTLQTLWAHVHIFIPWISTKSVGLTHFTPSCSLH